MIRDVGVFDKRSNKGFLDAGEGIPSTILANRLQLLVASGLLEKACIRTSRHVTHIS